MYEMSNPMETICMKCQILFSGKKMNISLMFAEFAQRVVKVKGWIVSCVVSRLDFPVCHTGTKYLHTATLYCSPKILANPFY